VIEREIVKDKARLQCKTGIRMREIVIKMEIVKENRGRVGEIA
jgi:hypothetical protein